MKKIARKLLDNIFEIGILIKAFFGFFEVMGGIIFAVSGKLIINNIILELAQQEIAEDPNDILANFLINLLSDFSAGSYLFAVAYLIFHGAVNVFLAVALFKNKLWAYRWAIAAFGSFAAYQTYRYFHTHSPMLLVLTIFDLFVITIIFLEYRKRKNK